MKTTDLNLIPVFVAIFEERSLSRAAKRLDITQPAVSKALSRLRDVYEDTLFNRTRSGVEPTSYASALYPDMSAIINNFNATLSSVHNSFEPATSIRSFSIACLHATDFFVLPELFSRIQQSSPGITLVAHPITSSDYENDLSLGKYDLIIGLRPIGNTLLKHKVILTGKMKVCCSADHPRVNESTITNEQFYAENHVAVTREVNREHVLSDADIKALNKRNIVYNASSFFETFPLIEKTDCIALLPSFMESTCREKFSIKTFDLPFDFNDISISMYWHPRKNVDTAHQWLRNQVCATTTCAISTTG
ncbi:LysR family transcriptional regulator [Vibrio splendidus]|jgi:DNA-binding transcriptional LysR family regulator|uniref:LysR family transcriptional regulator n=1 Tax=Vibrio splendidus TaxID=29497 RepID=UPI0002D3EA5A|nr:LysR family transcriptional regulator [Vibrio splendidus]MCC5518678.1 LysR family transcriptional regulator [Vibrio splendidus]MDP2589497.1 LysR family transcriptional regulator [Vibrio splendidus]OCH67770.1 LysR family transcriptional regulator [Vibrio splendidus]OEE55164.1 LysR family transcriptional regulator [Vibrio splendidus FF-500]